MFTFDRSQLSVVDMLQQKDLEKSFSEIADAEIISINTNPLSCDNQISSIEKDDK